MKLKVRDIAVFGMLGALMYASKVIMDVLPNIHPIGTFIVAMTVVYRHKALYPLYIFVLLTGLLNGFGTWWLPWKFMGNLLIAPILVAAAIFCQSSGRVAVARRHGDSALVLALPRSGFPRKHSIIARELPNERVEFELFKAGNNLFPIKDEVWDGAQFDWGVKHNFC